MSPEARAARTPATLAALAGSQPTPAASITALASRIASSLTARTAPFVSRITRTARSQLAGSPMRMAVATVAARTGSCVVNPVSNACAKGAAPIACTERTRGIFVMSPSACSSRNALPNADVFPRLPAGSTIQSGACQPSCWSISNTIVFCPSTRHGFTELARYTPSSRDDSRASRRQSSKSPFTISVRAP